jgi:phosphatidylserine decarboxylase
VLACGAALLGATLLNARRGETTAGRTVAALWLGALAFLMQFFRHPGCTTPLEPDLVVAPAAGRVVHIGLEEEPEVLRDRRLRISIFLSVFDAHLTRSPVTGRITYQRYHPGRYLVALHPKSSMLNERNSILVEHPGGTPVLVRQIAGFLARRICSYTAPGATVTAGQELGFIRLGSRVDLFLPPTSTVLVQLRQAVRAGETAIARLPPIRR